MVLDAPNESAHQTFWQKSICEYIEQNNPDWIECEHKNMNTYIIWQAYKKLFKILRGISYAIFKWLFLIN